MIAAITIGTAELLAIVAILTGISLLLAILARGSGWFNKKVRGLVDNDINQIEASLVRIETKVEKVDELEKAQMTLANQMNNGVKDRLDGLETSHAAHDVKLDGIADVVSGLKAMLELHLNWKGPDRRTDA